METNDNEDVKDFIEEITAARFFRTLTTDKREKGVYHAQLSFSSYVELVFTLRDLLKISLHTLYNDGLENSGQIANPSFHIASLLEIAIQLCPIVKRKH